MKHFVSLLFSTAFILFHAPSSFSADAITVSEYVSLKNDMKSGSKDNTLIIYLSGAADSLSSTNAVLIATNRPPLYCGTQSPISATIAIKLIDRLLAQQIKNNNPAPPNMAVTTVLANALPLEYPCK